MKRAVTEGIITEDRIRSFRRSLREAERSQATIAKYIRDINKLKSFITTRFGENFRITKDAVLSYKEYLGAEYKISSANSMIAAANSFFKCNGWNDLVIRPFKTQHKLFRETDRELTKAEYDRLVNAAMEKNNIRLALIIETICATGIRISELKFITAEAVRKGCASVRMKGKTRMIIIPPDMCDQLKNYMAGHDIRKGPVFVTRGGKVIDRSNIFHQMKALCDISGVPREKIFPHNLRHLFAVTYYRIEKDLAHLADILGHNNINTTRIYTASSWKEQARIISKMGLIKKPHNVDYVVI